MMSLSWLIGGTIEFWRFLSFGLTSAVSKLAECFATRCLTTRSRGGLRALVWSGLSADGTLRLLVTDDKLFELPR